MKLALCTTCKGRTAHVKKTLPQNIANNPASEAVFVLLDYNDDGELEHHVRATCQEHLASGKLVYYQYRDGGPFRMAHAKNMAHRCGMLEGANVLVNLDADNRTGPGFADYVAGVFERTQRDPQEVFLWSRMVKGVMKRGVTGRIALTRSAFMVAGGYDEKYNTYAPDDKDLDLRLRRLGYCAQEIDARFLDAVYHDDEVRFKDYPHLLGCENLPYDIASVSPHNRVVNCGRIGCGTVRRNFAEEIVLAPLPTRIFGIGLHKTATTSLCEALQLLGYKAGHWENPRWARQVWADMLHVGSSLPLEKFHAVTDLPVGLLYKELDAAYPGSKFVLTVRDEYEWLRSVEDHFDASKNEYRASWDHDAFTHRMHREVYGRQKFAWRVFLERYRRHNAEVAAYFKDRPGDLLVLKMDGACKWDELCAFLGQSVPDAPYPVAYQTTKENQ